MRISATVFLFSSSIVVGFSQENDQGKETPRKEKREQGPHFSGFIKHHDEDQDGRVSLEEFASGERAARLSEEAREKIFERLDKDGDGFITEKELKVRERDKPNPFLKKADDDGDGRISRKEFLANPPFPRVAEERLNKMFDQMDLNKDGFLDKKDREAGRGRMRPEGGGAPPRLNFQELDADQSGTVNLEEFQKAPWVKQMEEKERGRLFQLIDTNQDGEISPVELRTHLQKRFSKPPGGPNPRGPKK